jgi:hypothetical protein
MNDQDPNSQLDALFALARKQRPDTSAAEFAFETRLLARLRSEKQTGSVWAMVSWRLIPFFAACVVALTIWHSEIVSETTDTAQLCFIQNPEPADSWTGAIDL